MQWMVVSPSTASLTGMPMKAPRSSADMEEYACETNKNARFRVVSGSVNNQMNKPGMTSIIQRNALFKKVINYAFYQYNVCSYGIIHSKYQ